MLGQCFHFISAENPIVLSLFLAGLAGGFTHCVPMCGAFVLAQTNDQVSFARLSGRSLLPYHLGRATSYILLAVLFSTFLNVALLYLPARGLIVGPLLLLAALIFLAAVFPALTRVFPWFSRLHLPMPKGWLHAGYNALMSVQGSLRGYSLGVLLGFMPCGLVVAALLAASSAATPAVAALAMAAFALGTVPALLGVSFGATAIRRVAPSLFFHLKTVSMLASALWLCVLAGQFLI